MHERNQHTLYFINQNYLETNVFVSHVTYYTAVQCYTSSRRSFCVTSHKRYLRVWGRESHDCYNVTCYEIWRGDLWLVELEVTQDVDITHHPRAYSPKCYSILYDHLHLAACVHVLQLWSHVSSQLTLLVTLSSLTRYPGQTAPLLFSAPARLSRLPGPGLPGPLGAREKLTACTSDSPAGPGSRETRRYSLMVKNILYKHF